MSRNVELFDGSMHQALREAGVPLEYMQDHPLWTGGANLDYPNEVKHAHKKFIDAGCTIISTNTYHVCLNLARDRGISNSADYILQGIELLRQVIQCSQKEVKVLGSIGCYGASLRDCSEYTGAYVDEQSQRPHREIDDKMRNYYKEQFNAMNSDVLDCIIIETVPALDEVYAIISSLAFTKKKVIISFTCDDGGRKLRHGEELADAVKLVKSHDQIAGIGINCTKMQAISRLLEGIQGDTKMQIFVYPNISEEEWSVLTRHGNDRAEAKSMIEQWMKLGATAIGACCGTPTSVIKEIGEIIDESTAGNKSCTYIIST